MQQGTQARTAPTAETARILQFYDRHPISEQHVLAAVAARRGGLDGPLSSDDLFDFDQDHYGGLAATDELVHRAGITHASRVLDVCAGLGGPARFLATRRRCRVVGIELNAGRAAGAARLTRRVRLAGRVVVVRGDARALPFTDGSFDACISQEALLHISDKATVLAGCHRVLVPGGRLAFTDWIAHPRLGDRERERLGAWMAATTLQTLEGYRTLLGNAGFTSIDAEDLTDEWRRLFRRRLAAYRSLRPSTAARLGDEAYPEYDQLHGFLVDLVENGKLGGGRFSASR
jgi:ubiquinone/menaquinone biosynthesis C-methylase UbiE